MRTKVCLENPYSRYGGIREAGYGQAYDGTPRAADQRSFTLIEAGSDGEVTEDRAGTMWVGDPVEAFRMPPRTPTNCRPAVYGLRPRRADDRALAVGRH